MDIFKNKLLNCLVLVHLKMLKHVKSYQFDQGLIDLDRGYSAWANATEDYKVGMLNFSVSSL